jgi:carboxyl-terminal processing protease
VFFVEDEPIKMSTRPVSRTLLLTLAIAVMVILAFSAGVASTWLFTRTSAMASNDGGDLGLFWEAWHLVERRFFGELPEAQQLAWGVIRGALGTLNDPHTTFLEPQPRQREKEVLSGRFGGIGAYVMMDEEGRIILDPMPDLPAEQAGVQSGDVLIRVDDTEIKPEDTAEAVVELIRGEVGTTVRLTLLRPGSDQPVVVEIERQEIPSPSLEWRILDEAPDIGYVRVLWFSDRSATELADALEDLREQGMRQLIFDLRGNTGGLFDAAIDVSSAFLDEGVVVYQIEKDGKEEVFRARGRPHYASGELAVLVDSGTASASEIVAGALQDRERALLVGEKTYGKGSVQEIYDLSDGSSVHITAAKWFTPNRRQIDGQGLAPDLEVPMTDEDRSQGFDPQLEKAIEVLTQGR